MKRLVLICLLCCCYINSYCWGFFAHQRINYYAAFLLPPEMMVMFKPHIRFLSDHATDADKRRYVVAEEAPRHYIDIDYYGPYPYDALPRKWEDAIAKYTLDTLQSKGIVPWWINIMVQRLTNAFKEKNGAKILKTAADLAHYVADAHVPLHATQNHDGQLTGQKGIHAFWEGRIPELLAETTFDFIIGKAIYIENVPAFTWSRVLESAALAQQVLQAEASLTKEFPGDQKFAFEDRNGKLIRQYSAAFSIAYNKKLENMVETRMRESIRSVASLWYTAWVNAGQPDLKELTDVSFTASEISEFDSLNRAWRNNPARGRTEND
ncbi:S1/P1 Nuclease [Segetibacter sp. 3557_3]|uniref:zinc dependent phospholipase C family protein n=1 Tax=Segetibacter sp. 3557_3 TaxID=2547429 RepID=UPI001058A20C|nr:zinc dependent phospholipase C family protein [Segetibacter sp. 3557_3]TDH26186.1 S1/P1 Nuclease [Segetibacter sp. 3557_3]